MFAFRLSFVAHLRVTGNGAPTALTAAGEPSGEESRELAEASHQHVQERWHGWALQGLRHSSVPPSSSSEPIPSRGSHCPRRGFCPRRPDFQVAPSRCRALGCDGRHCAPISVASAVLPAALLLPFSVCSL